jgi:hypothetical protein
MFTMENYSTIKKNKFMSFAGKWMELKIIILSEINQTQTVKYKKTNMFSSVCDF